MMIAARHGMLVEAPNPLPYIRDGLVAWWDGIWNAGIDAHDANATTWADLTGGDSLVLTNGTLSWTDKSLVLSVAKLKRKMGTLLASALNNGSITVEVCYIASNRGYPVKSYPNTQAFEIWRNGTVSMYFRLWGLDNIGGMGYGAVVRSATTPPLEHLVYAADSSTGECACYLDGAFIRTNSFANPQTVTYDSNTELWIGNSSGESFLFTGMMSALRIYSRALTADEIAHNYAIDRERFGLP